MIILSVNGIAKTVFSPYVGKALLLDERVGERPRLSDVLTDLQENASLCECFP